MTTLNSKKLHIDIVSDVVCPWCIVGYRQLEKALQASGTLSDAARPLRFKHSACVTPPFGRLKVSVKPEIVAHSAPTFSMAPALTRVRPRAGSRMAGA